MRRVTLTLFPDPYTACTGTALSVFKCHKPLTHLFTFPFIPGKADTSEDIFVHLFRHEETTLKSGFQLHCFQYSKLIKLIGRSDFTQSAKNESYKK
jgi:hypothetical protein